MKTQIIVKLQFEALHNWPGVVNYVELNDVHFLKDPHRHIFHVTAKKAVGHADREVEIIMFKRNILKHLKNRFQTLTGLHDMQSTSCEMLAQELCKVFGLTYCSVLEDNENGAECYYEPIDTEVIDEDSLPEDMSSLQKYYKTFGFDTNKITTT